MSKVKHLLRKLHIGDHNHHARPPPAALDPSPQPPSNSSLSSPSSSDLPHTASSSENEYSRDNNSFFDEEFEIQLALAISVSDQGQSCVDSETAQINAAKQISLGRAPTQSLPEFLSVRYWSSNVVNYDEKVMDGFYDVCGIDSNLVMQAKMPSLVDLETMSAEDDVGYEVILVNRAIDLELRKLEEIVYCMSVECHVLDNGLKTSILVQKIADLIVERMGGPVSDVEDMLRRWRVKNRELRISLKSIILPIGSLDVGHSRQRALLFKVLADRINLPCKIVKGSYYTGTDEGAVNLIKFDDGSEYIIDLMGAPGTLIPAEVPSGHHQNFGLDARTIFSSAWIEKSSSSKSENETRNKLPLTVDGTANTESSSPESCSTATESNRNGRIIVGKNWNEHMTARIGDSSLTSIESVLDQYAADAEMEPPYPGEFHTMLSEISASKPEDFLLYPQSHDLRKKKALEGNGLVREDTVVNQSQQQRYLRKDDQFTLTSAGINFMNNVSHNCSRKESIEGLAAFQFTKESAGNKLSTNAPNERNALFKDRNDEVKSKIDAAINRELVEYPGCSAMEVDRSDQSNASRMQDGQIDQVLNGIAEILWEELQIGERIGIGSYGEVYRADWNGTEVAVKKFMKQDISGVALAQFQCEIEIMLRLRHPNVVLFMGAVTRPPNMSILTEFLPRGSLYKLLHRPNIQIDEKRRIKMALDVAKGMNYLHTSNPIIVHRDLKTPNLLVDKNWVVKVGDFGMSRLQHHTYLSSKSTAGTAEWMAPEVLRNEPSNEKSDVYSFGVILWELATLRVPWTELNSMQVVGAVGFQDRHLDIPSTVDTPVAEIISECWNRNPQARPSFAQIITRLKCIHRLTLLRMETRTFQQ